MHKGAAFVLALVLLAHPAASQAGQKKKKNSDTTAIGQRDINKRSWNLYSPERELALGEELAHQTERSARLLNDPLVLAYVQEVAGRIARHSDLRMPLRVRVIDSDDVNAFALPGGHFFIHTGLLLETRSEAELAGVIAHEIAHVAARHATRQMTKVQVYNWMSLPLFFVGGPVAYGIQQGLALAVPLTFLKFSRKSEIEADFLGAQYHFASGYDPAAFVDFFERMKQREKSSKSSIAKAFSTHPMTKERIRAAERTIEEVLPSQEEYVINTSEHEQMLSHLRALLDQRKGQEGLTGPVLRKRNTRGDSPPKGKGTSPF